MVQSVRCWFDVHVAHVVPDSSAMGGLSATPDDAAGADHAQMLCIAGRTRAGLSRRIALGHVLHHLTVKI